MLTRIYMPLFVFVSPRFVVMGARRIFYRGGHNRGLGKKVSQRRPRVELSGGLEAKPEADDRL